MNDLPAPTAEGKLIRQARELAVPRLSIRAAAARISISPEHWGNIERGYKSSGADEAPRRLDASAALIAKMARAVHITPEQMETEGRRPDAAAAMREVGHRESPRPIAPVRDVLPEPTDEMEEAMRRFLADAKARAEVARGAYPGERLTGKMVFPRGPALAQRMWDGLAAKGWPEEDIPAGVAFALTIDMQEAQADGQASQRVRGSDNNG